MSEGLEQGTQHVSKVPHNVCEQNFFHDLVPHARPTGQGHT